MEYMEKNDKDKDVVIFTEEGYGDTQSNIIQFLEGNQSTEERFEDLSRSSNLIGIKIPTKWTLRRHLNLPIWDFPKLVNIQDPVQDITIAFYLYQLLQNAKSLKILVFSYGLHIVQGSIAQFSQNFNVIERIFGNKFKDLFPSIGYLFKDLPRKIVDQEFSITQYSDEIKKELESFTNRRDLTSSNIKDYLKYLINNFYSQTCFSTDKYIPGPVENYFYRFIRSNVSIQENQLLELPLNILNSSKLCLSNVNDKLFSTQKINQLLNIIKVKNRRNINLLTISARNTDNKDELNALLMKSNQIQNAFTNLNSKANEIVLYKRIEFFESFFDIFENENDRHDLLRAVKVMNFLDKVLGTNESKDIDLQFQDIVGSLILDVNIPSFIITEKLKTMSKK